MEKSRKRTIAAYVAVALAGRLARAPTRIALRLDSQLTRSPALAGTRTQRRHI